MKEPDMVTASDRLWPRVMRVRPRGRTRSVDRGKRRPGIELRNHQSGVPTWLTVGEGHTIRVANARRGTGPTESKTLRMRGHFMHENREIPCVPADEESAGRPEQATHRTSGVHAHGKSDRPIVPMKPPNKAGPTAGRRRRWREGA